MANLIKGSAKDIFEAYVEYLNSIGLKFNSEESEDGYVIRAAGTGEDIPMYFSIEVDAKRELIILLSHMPYNMDKERRVEGAVATSILNHLLADGSFDYNINTGSIIFRLTNSFRGGMICDEIFKYMFSLSGRIVDRYNDKLLMVSTGAWSVQDFADYVEKN